MKKEEPIYFDEEKAKSYESKFSKISALKEALHLITQFVFSDSPRNSRMLCIGAGTGSELLYLAEHFSSWEFDIVESSEPMLEVCIEQCKKFGIDSRCNFHLGDFNSFVSNHKYDVATSFLVSHFFSDRIERLNYFKNINAKLKPGGILVNADLSGDINSDLFQRVIKVWRECLFFSGLEEAEVNKMCSSFGVEVAMIKPIDVEDLLIKSGFEKPTLFYQALFIHSWFSRRIS